MKRFFIAIVFLFLMFGTCFWTLSHLEKNTTAIKNEIERLQHAVEADNTSAASESMQRLMNQWQDERTLFHALAGSAYCQPFESALNRASVLLAQNESSEVLAELSELYSRINQLWDTQALRLHNLF